MKRERPELKIVGHFVKEDDRRVEIDPRATALPDICKQAFAFMKTGEKYSLIR
ncbi:hypothetical protein [Paenibacillus sp. GbtcB18]|uniref:hypothetical protein n=1 Tax=Paenibacillus sp. GbtcB18 TaxID=2824763 RepID=UPI001C2F188C|nr:hypothetical protein [Paenibacillus sp. GbtcB18]